MFSIIGLLLGLMVTVINAIGRTAWALVRDVLIATTCVVKSLFIGVAALGAMLIGRWSTAKRYGANIRSQLLRAGKRLSDIPTSAVVSRRAGSPRSGGNDFPETSDNPFPGWSIIGDMAECNPGHKAGGSGAKLLIARPVPPDRFPVEKAVLKVFDLKEGSEVPQLVRESQSLEGARRLGMVLEHGMDEQRFWYAMPFIPGENLARALESMHKGSQGLQGEDLRRGLLWCRDLLTSLAEFHEAGLWHKDIKPENIIVNTDGAHVVDFGLVTSLSSAMTLTGHGTQFYRDPHLSRLALNGTKVADVNGAKFDIYSAGAVLYYIVEGTFPEHGSLSRFEQPSPPAVQMVVRRAMADYDKRYASVAEMARDLQVVLESSSINSVVPADLPSMQQQEATRIQVTPDDPIRVTVGDRIQITPDDLRRVPPSSRGLWQVRTAMLHARDARTSSRLPNPPQPGPWREVRRERRSGRRHAVGTFLVGLITIGACLLIAISAGLLHTTTFDERGSEQAPKVVVEQPISPTIEPVGEGNALVINEISSDPAAGETLAIHLTTWGWHPVRDAETEATFRRSLPVAGPTADDFEDRVRAAIKELRLDAAAFLHVDESDPDKAWVLMLTEDDIHRLKLSDVQ